MLKMFLFNGNKRSLSAKALSQERLFDRTKFRRLQISEEARAYFDKMDFRERMKEDIAEAVEEGAYFAEKSYYREYVPRDLKCSSKLQDTGIFYYWDNKTKDPRCRLLAQIYKEEVRKAAEDIAKEANIYYEMGENLSVYFDWLHPENERKKNKYSLSKHY